MQLSTIISWLHETDPARLAELWQLADQTRQQHVGGEVHLRGLVELSNFCVRLCGYCGLRAANRNLHRYRMSHKEVMTCARRAIGFGYGTLVLQSGEDPGITARWMTRLVRHIKTVTPLAVTLSLGERSDEELVQWREAGADRYLLRFETSNRSLYDQIHPSRNSAAAPATQSGQQDPPARTDHPRIHMLRRLRELGYEVGSGVMIGIPGQTYADLARDIELFAELELDMIGVGPYLVHPDTPLADPAGQPRVPEDQQVPATELMTYKIIALSRLACPRANIPATTALATLNRAQGRELGLVRGANVIMPNLTPPNYRTHYEIYPNKACLRETADACSTCIGARIRAIGRQPGTGRGDSANYHYRQTQPWQPKSN